MSQVSHLFVIPGVLMLLCIIPGVTLLFIKLAFHHFRSTTAVLCHLMSPFDAYLGEFATSQVSHAATEVTVFYPRILTTSLVAPCHFKCPIASF